MPDDVKAAANAATVAEANRVIAVAYRALCSAREILTYGERRDTIDGAIDEIESWKQRRGVT